MNGTRSEHRHTHTPTDTQTHTPAHTDRHTHTPTHAHTDKHTQVNERLDYGLMDYMNDVLRRSRNNVVLGSIVYAVMNL